MESVEVSAKTVDEAIDIALEELGLKRSQVDIEVLSSGKPGLFGLGGEQARVRVIALEEGTARPIQEEEKRKRRSLTASTTTRTGLKATSRSRASMPKRSTPRSEFLRELITLMDIQAECYVRAPETPADGLGRATAVLDIEGDDLGPADRAQGEHARFAAVSGQRPGNAQVG